MFRYRHPEVHQEDDDLPWGRVLAGLAAMVLIGGVLTVWAVVVTVHRDAALRPSRGFPEARLGPRRQVGMIQEALFDGARPGQELFAAQRAELGRFGVVDRDHGIVSIPIDDAIRLVVDEAGR
jgi:hypothetical protein